jgi:pterin-4a-carbinolamine dehydratase
MSSRPREQKLKPERVQLELATMPGWELSPEGKAILRTRRFGSKRAAGAFAAYVSSLAWDAGQPVRLQLDRTRLTIRLVAPSSRFGRIGELTMSVLDFARELG